MNKIKRFLCIWTSLILAALIVAAGSFSAAAVNDNGTGGYRTFID